MGEAIPVIRDLRTEQRNRTIRAIVHYAVGTYMIIFGIWLSPSLALIGPLFIMWGWVEIVRTTVIEK